mgnify:CR=1 FL=1
MNKQLVCVNKNFFYIVFFIIIILLVILMIFIFLNYNKSLYKSIKESFQKNNIQTTENINLIPPINIVNEKSQQEITALERIYNPLKFPYKSKYFYNQDWYPNLKLPSQVIGCGGRQTPCLGGTQIAIENPLPPINISDDNIAPINISTRGPIGEPQQIGALYKIFGNDNNVLPLFGRRKYPNDNKWEYYTMMGRFGVKMPLIVPNKNVELGTNETVFIKGIKNSAYRVTLYENDLPQYVPYI